MQAIMRWMTWQGSADPICPDPPARGAPPALHVAFPAVDRFSVAFFCGRDGRSTTQNGGRVLPPAPGSPAPALAGGRHQSWSEILAALGAAKALLTPLAPPHSLHTA
jgi:hypothetical protein